VRTGGFSGGGNVEVDMAAKLEGGKIRRTSPAIVTVTPNSM
jgi:hypothetical protein